MACVCVCVWDVLTKGQYSDADCARDEKFVGDLLMPETGHYDHNPSRKYSLLQDPAVYLSPCQNH